MLFHFVFNIFDKNSHLKYMGLYLPRNRRQLVPFEGLVDKILKLFERLFQYELLNSSIKAYSIV